MFNSKADRWDPFVRTQLDGGGADMDMEPTYQLIKKIKIN
jgi:hypothetical protein